MGTLTYNAAGQMIAAANSTNGNGTYSYAGTNENELVSQVVPGGKTVYYTYGRKDTNGLPQIEQVGLNGTYAYIDHDPTTSQPLTLRLTNGAEAFYVLDGLNRPVALTTTAGTTSTYAYDPYGTTTNGGSGSAGGQNPYQFAPGSIYDRTTNMLKYGQRWYDTSSGRFTQQDSITHLDDPQQGNKYAYAGDDPVNNADASGRGILDFVDDVVTEYDDVIDYAATYIISCNDTGVSLAVGGAVAGAILGDGVGAAPAATAAYVGGCVSGVIDEATG